MSTATKVSAVVFLTIFVLIVLLIAGTTIARRNSRRVAHDAFVEATPLDPRLSEVYVTSWDHSADRDGEDALRAASEHILRVAEQKRELPLAAFYARDVHNHLRGGLLVALPSRILYFTDGRVQSLLFDVAAETSIEPSRSGSTRYVEVHVGGPNGGFIFPANSLDLARKVCAVIDMWVDNRDVAFDPQVLVTSRRVEVPDAFFENALRAAGHPVTPGNMRSLHERFGMMFISKARTYLDSAKGLEEGERFTHQFGRPGSDLDLPLWPANVLRGWIKTVPGYSGVIAAMPHMVRKELLSSDYLSHPERPLSMWRGDRDRRDEEGSMRDLGPDLPSATA